MGLICSGFLTFLYPEQLINLSNIKITFLECRESNQGPLGEKQGCYLCASSPPILAQLTMGSLFSTGFSQNGELLVDPSAGDAAFSEVVGEDFVPSCSLDIGQKVKLNFGHDVDTLKFFTMCGLQEGYEPFCV